MAATLCLATVATSSADAAVVRIKDIADFEGIRDNMLVGYGLVVGLNGTGDTLNNSPFTRQSLESMLERLGVNTRNGNSNTDNLAAVMVTATIPPFARQGTRIDVAVSSLGDAENLQGGTLLVTPLLGADGEVYAVSQGQVEGGDMSSSVQDHVIERIEAAPIQRLPTPHFFINGIFPDDFYTELLANFPEQDGYVCLADTGRVKGDAFRERFVFMLTDEVINALPEPRRSFWREMQGWFLGEPLFRALVAKFAAAAATRFADRLAEVDLTSEVLVVRDHSNYAIGPHTDATHRFLSLLFYCPPDNSMEHLGTSLYMPTDRNFVCPGGPHYPFDKFICVDTMPYRPNSLFGFLKTKTSFHGVEPIADENVCRDVILYDIRLVNNDRERDTAELLRM